MKHVSGRPDSGIARRALLRIVSGVAVSAALIWFASRNVDWPNVWRQVLDADPLWLAVALASVLLTTLAKAIRWRLMFFPRHRELSLLRFAAAFLVGQMLNALVPLRLGELVRAYLISKSEQVSQVRAIWTTVLEKILDSAVLLVFVVGLSLSMGLPAWLGRAAWILGGALALSMAALGLMVPLRMALEKALVRLETRHVLMRRMRLSRIWREAVQSVATGRDPEALVGLSTWSLVAFLLAALTNWLTARALHLRLAWDASLLLLSVLQMSAAVPVPTLPGRMGLFHYLVILSLALVGIGREASISYALILHVVVYAPMMAGGALGMWAWGSGWHDMRQALDGKSPAVEDDADATQLLDREAGD
jgi:uncharacterized protein (TIRG00374 family)